MPAAAGPGRTDGGEALRDVAAPGPPEPGVTVAVLAATVPGAPDRAAPPLHAGTPTPTAAASSTATVAVAARWVALTRSS